MKAIPDRSFQNAPRLESDLGAYFNKLWRELDERESRAANSWSIHGKVRLDCNSELADIGSIGLVVVRASPFGAELVEFVCPHCAGLHESPRLA